MTDTARELVVVGVDGSEADGETLTWAAAEASRRHGELLIVHAQDVIDGAAVSESPVESLPFEGQDFAEGLMSRSVRWVTQRSPALSVRSLTRREKAPQLLLEQSEHAALLVLGTHGDNRFVGALLGSVSQKLAAHARCPVVVLPVGTPQNSSLPNSVVVGVSASAGGRAALRFAFAEAQLREAELVAVRCWQDSAVLTAGAAGFGYITIPVEDSLDDGEKSVLDYCLAEIQPEFPDVKVRAELAEAPTDPVLIEYSAQAALMVIGCRHQDGHRLSRLGPIGSWLLHNSKAPIAVVGFHKTEPETSGTRVDYRRE
jgi:nucleotide-binding universal stress UspA family protein